LINTIQQFLELALVRDSDCFERLVRLLHLLQGSPCGGFALDSLPVGSAFFLVLLLLVAPGLFFE
jgi:hypothetical protein